jgi:type VI secretion system protein VasG
MVAVDLQSVVARLNPHARRALEGAVGLAVSRTHYNVELEHWLLKLLEQTDGDLLPILRHYEIDPTRVAADLTRTLDKLKTGNSRPPALSVEVVRMAREAWVLASLQYGEGAVRSGHLLAALLADEQLSPRTAQLSSQFNAITPDVLRRDLARIVDASVETGQAAAATAARGGAQAAGAAGPSPSGGKTPALDQYTIDLTANARAGKIDPVLGRDAELRQVMDILTRRRQNNPILTGEAGVGKTAVVEGFALRIAAGDVPPSLQGVRLLSLDLGLLQAGAGMKGEFENRLKSVIEEVKSSTTPIIMFIDEAHTLIGAGGAAGQNDAANLLKPALARGEMRTIAATTWAEYKKYFERDPALTRRFQVVKVEEPGDAAAIAMMRGVVPTLEKHHGVRIFNEAVEEVVRLSRRYIPSRQLPDKGVSLLDTACARVSMSQSATPAAIEDLRRRLEAQDADAALVRRESAIGLDHGSRLDDIAAARAAAQSELEALEIRWGQEKELAQKIRGLRDRLSATTEAQDGSDASLIRAELDRANAELDALQGETPLIKTAVDGQAIAEVIANWTGIAVGRMVKDEIKTVLELKERLEERIIGQPHALEAIAQAIRTSRAKLSDPRKPLGVFLMVGTSGVGKTETALALAELLYGGEQNVTVINMSEFKEEHKVSMLLGSPPGYVGFGEGGVLTEAVRRKPYSIVLLDEMEKAHPGVQDIFYQVFDKGMLRDGEGRDIDFKNTIVIMTSNAGTDLIHKLCADPDTMPDASGLAEALRPELLKIFKPAFLGRTTMVPYFPLSEGILRKIIELSLNRIRRRFVENYKATFTWDESLIDAVAARCTEVESGGRNVENVLSRGLLPELSAQLLAAMADGTPIRRVHVGADGTGGFRYDFEQAVTAVAAD